MLYGLYLSAGGASVQDARVDSIAHNLANVNTPGFHRLVQTFSERPPESAEEPGSVFDSDPLLDNIGGGVFFARTFVDRAPGPMRHTGRDLDIAIRGSGYLAVKSGKEVLYTRAGNLLLDENRILRTATGYPVLDTTGAEIELEDPKNDPFVNRLLLRDFPKDATVRKVGANLLRFEGTGTDLEPSGRIVQGFVEQSGVSAVRELVRMIEAQRGYEANIRMIQFQDETLQQAVRELPRIG